MNSIPVQRRSGDLILNTRGKKLLNLCKQCGLRILNGRMLRDSLGQYTSHHLSGSSYVIYYFIESKSILSLVVLTTLFLSA